MNNEIKRKITSLTLMTIMLAGGMTFAIPGELPQAHAENPNLIVSASTFGGPMVIEIIVNDPNYKDDDDESMPGVTFDGNDLVMAQGSDGNWYAYVAEKNNANYANTNTLGINFGTLESTPNAFLGSGITFDLAASVYVLGSTLVTVDPVLKSPKGLSTTAVSNGLGQIDIIGDVWPFIQTFELTDDSDIKVVYETTPAQTEVIIYDEDMDDFASYSTDRTSYPHNADIHLVIDDMQLNIDPTDEDIWTFNVSNGTSYYGEDSIIQINSTAQDALYYKDNGFLDIDEKYVIEFQSNDDSNTALLALDESIFYVTVEETSPNTGLFENTDSGNTANLITTNNPIRDDSGVIDYNNDPASILIAYFNGAILMDEASIDGVWRSGMELTVTVNDQDENKNTKSQDIFDVADPNFEAIPAIRIGDPITLDGNTVIALSDGSTITDLENANVALQDELDTAESDLETLESNLDNQQDLIDAQQIVFDDALAAFLDETTNTVLEDAYNDADDALNDLIDDYALIELDIAAEELIIKNNSAQIIANNIAIALGIPGSIIPIPTVDEFSSRLIISPISLISGTELIVYYDDTIGDLQDFINSTTNVYSFVNYDVSSLNLNGVTISVSDGTDEVYITSGDIGIDNSVHMDALLIAEIAELNPTSILSVVIGFVDTAIPDGDYPLVIDFMRYSGDVGRINDAIYRFEAEETTHASGIFTGTVEYVMLNQINMFNLATFSGLETIGDELDIIVHEDLTEEDAIELIYYDVDKQGINTQVSDQMEAYTNSGVVSFDDLNYKVADTVTITIEDHDLNTNSDLVDIYTVVDSLDTIADVKYPVDSRLLDITFDDNLWESNDSCITVDVNGDDVTVAVNGLYDSMSSIIETGKSTGVFTGTFQIPKNYCNADGDLESVTGLDIEVNYVDFRDASGEVIEVGDSAGIRAHTGSISLDRTVYPVPFGLPSEAANDDGSFFALHDSAFDDDPNDDTVLKYGDLTIHVRVNDPDFDLSASGEDTIAEEDTTNGPVKVMISRGSDTVVVGTAGAATTGGNLITIGDDIVKGTTFEYGPIIEIAPGAGIFELDLTIRYTDGPSSTTCPDSVADSISHIDSNDVNHCILQGDIITVEYTDPTDASGDINTVTDSATFDLRNGVLQSDKSVYIIGSDMILTLIEPDFDLDNDQAETYDLDLIEWDSDAATLSMGNRGGEAAAFDPEPSNFRETGDSTGIFQIVIEIPEALDDDNLDRGEKIELEYTDWGPSGSDYVGDEDEDVNLTIFTSNFGATVELDQKVYTWTDKVYITIVAPDHNFDSDLIDEIGNTSSDPIKVSTRGHDIDEYKLVETGTDTGIFTGEVILTGFEHDADGDTTTGTDGNDVTFTIASGSGPTDGLLPADDDDGLTVSFEYSEDETVLGSALIRWNIGETQWLEASYPASGTGVVRVIDPDMNLNPEAVDNYDIDVWSDSDVGGIDLTVTETNEATGIFEGTVFFTTTDESSGHRLRVAEGDTVTAEYEDNTLPDPYTTADELDISATTLIGTIVPPLERAPAANLRTVDAFGNSLSTVSVDQQVQISADLSNGQDRTQAFAYLVQLQNADGVTVSLAWITGSLENGQSFSPALSWIPTDVGTYTATAFVWESVDNPTALSPPVTTTIIVS